MTTSDLAARREYWKYTVIREPCVMCIAFPVRDPLVLQSHMLDLRERQAHHVTDQQHIKSYCRTNGIDPDTLLWVEDNGMCLCRYHHQRHTNWSQRVPRRLILEPAWAFARSLGLEWRLEADYPAD